MNKLKSKPEPLKTIAQIPLTKGEGVFRKIIYNHAGKTTKQVYDALQLEAQWLVSQHPGMELQKFSEPIKTSDGALIYDIYLK